MILLTLVALWALIRGSITVAPKLKLEGSQARAYGVLLLVFAFVLLEPLRRLVVSVAGDIDPESAVSHVFNLMLTIAIILGLALLTKIIKLPPPKES